MSGIDPTQQDEHGWYPILEDDAPPQKRTRPQPKRPPPGRAKPRAKKGAGRGRGGSTKKPDSVKALRNQRTAAQIAATTPPPPRVQRDYVALGLQYARDVCAGKIVACRWVKFACKRQLDDIAKQSDPSYPWIFDEQGANAFCFEIEEYPHIKGRWASDKKLISLEPWQCFALTAIFGWKRRTGKHAGKRRFREIYWQVPRKNGKSVIAALIGNHMLTNDGEHGAEVYAGATSEKQAWEVFGPAKLMFERAHPLQSKYGVEVWAKALVRPADNSKFWPVIGKPGDGMSPSCAIIDEYHEHSDSTLVDTMVTGMGAREQPLLLIITTAGTDLSSPCYDKAKEAQKVLEGIFNNDELFALIYTIDEDIGHPGEPGYVKGDDWTDPKAIIKANPNLGVSVDEEFLLAQQRNAIINPAYQNRFKTKHLNVWCSASVAGINMALFKKCADESLKIEQFYGHEVYASLDLASKTDVCSYARVFKKQINGAGHYYVFVKHYLPERTIEETKVNEQAYRKWVATSKLIATDGAEIDFDLIREEVRQDSQRMQFQEIAYDPWRATQLAHQLTKDGAKVVEMGQTAKNMGAAFDEFLSAIKAGRFHYDGDPVLEWMASNVIAKEVMKGLVIPAKEKRDQKIDGIVAVVMAISRAMTHDGMGGMMDFFKNAVRA